MCLGLASGYKEPEKKMSLLKPYTNFDRLKDASIDEMAVIYPCPYERDSVYDGSCADKDCIECTKQWLESEVTE